MLQTISNAILKLVNKIVPNKQYTASWYKQTMNNKALPLNWKIMKISCWILPRGVLHLSMQHNKGWHGTWNNFFLPRTWKFSFHSTSQSSKAKRKLKASISRSLLRGCEDDESWDKSDAALHCNERANHSENFLLNDK